MIEENTIELRIEKKKNPYRLNKEIEIEWNG